MLYRIYIRVMFCSIPMIVNKYLERRIIMRRIKKQLVMLVFVSALLVAVSCCAYAAGLPTCVIEKINTGYDEAISDELMLNLTDGQQLCIAVFQFGQMQGYLYNPADDSCRLYIDVTPSIQNARLHPFDSDPQAFSLSNDNESMTWRWNGDGLSLTRWSNSDYTVAIDGDSLIFTTNDGKTIQTQLASQLSVWMTDYADLPQTPEEAQKLIEISEEAVVSLLPGFTLCEYSTFNGGDEAEAFYARVTEEKTLQLAWMYLNAKTGERSTRESMSIPVTEVFIEMARQKPLSELVCASYMSETFLYPDSTLDLLQIPVKGKILQSELQSRCLVLITEEEDGRHFVCVTRNENGDYLMDRSGVMPESVFMDVFHNGDSELFLQWEGQSRGASWEINSEGKWRLSAIIGEEGNYCPEYGCVSVSGEETLYLHGAFSTHSLRSGRLSDLPASVAELKACIDTEGWAVVNNPNAEDRLYLRKKPERGADVFGKFWNGTPVQVLESKGDWCHVAIGTNGFFDGWMMKKYLAFGSQMDQIQNAYPYFVLREEICRQIDTHQVWKDSWLTDLADWELRNDEQFHIIGISEAEGKKPTTLIIMNLEGKVGYVPSGWFWEGNG